MRLPRLNVEVHQRIGQRIGRRQFALGQAGIGAADIKDQVAGRVLLAGVHGPARSSYDQQPITAGEIGYPVAGMRAIGEKPDGLGAAQIKPRLFQRLGNPRTGVRAIGQNRDHTIWTPHCLGSQHACVGFAIGGEEHQFSGLQPVTVQDRDFIAFVDRHRARAATGNRVPLGPVWQDRQAGCQNTRALIWRFKDRADRGADIHVRASSSDLEILSTTPRWVTTILQPEGEWLSCAEPPESDMKSPAR
ncbi:hypothetical protein ROA7745_04627 [Roseovarius aestuarii]|uniref:Uncharacterized protein n=1 Tax=Roseovarius aestuarii TaxID=475083 RepID=A0A1X7BYN1_9RHOB|nr:hypothetical protein ROA7745_04627 [Roseovarius aestuarii]